VARVAHMAKHMNVVGGPLWPLGLPLNPALCRGSPYNP